MLKDLLSFVFDKAKEQLAHERPIKIDIPTDGRTQFWYTNGELECIKVDNPIVRFATNSLPHFVTMAVRWLEKAELFPLGIYVGNDKVQMLDNEQGPNRETITMPLMQSELYQFVANMTKQTVYLDQASLIRNLRTLLSTAPESTKMLAAAKSIVWKNTSIDSMKFDSGRESLGASVEREIVTGNEDGLGETLTLNIDVFSNATSIVPGRPAVKIDVSIDHANKRIGLKASADDLNRLVMWTQDRIVSDICELLDRVGHGEFAKSGGIVVGSAL